MRDFKLFQGVKLLQSITASMAETFLQKTSNLNPKISIYQPPSVLRQQLYFWMMSDLWLRLILFLDKKFRIENNQIFLLTHDCYDLQSEITNKAHSTP